MGRGLEGRVVHSVLKGDMTCEYESSTKAGAREIPRVHEYRRRKAAIFCGDTGNPDYGRTSVLSCRNPAG